MVKVLRSDEDLFIFLVLKVKSDTASPHIIRGCVIGCVDTEAMVTQNQYQHRHIFLLYTFLVISSLQRDPFAELQS